MTSKATLELLTFMGSLSYRIGAMPFRVVAARAGVDGLQLVEGTQAQRLLWLTQNACNLSFIVVMYYVLGLWYEFTQPVTMVESSQYYFLMSVFSLSFCCHVGVLLCWGRWRALANRLLGFNSEICKRLNRNDNKVGNLSISKFMMLALLHRCTCRSRPLRA